jgi:hypothetical protein
VIDPMTGGEHLREITRPLHEVSHDQTLQPKGRPGCDAGLEKHGGKTDDWVAE